MKKMMKNRVLKATKEVAFNSAMNSVNQTCTFVFHQPKIPKQALKLKKHD